MDSLNRHINSYQNIYIKNNLNQDIHQPINISEKAAELLETHGNKQTFVSIMRSIDREVMGDDILSDAEEFHDETYTNNLPINRINKNHEIKYNRINTYQNNYDFSKTPIRQRSGSPGNLSINNKQRPINKKYTDVHANSKYYYPDENLSDDDLQPSQWNDRSNRNRHYGNRIDTEYKPIEIGYEQDHLYKDINYRPNFYKKTNKYL